MPDEPIAPPRKRNSYLKRVAVLLAGLLLLYLVGAYLLMPLLWTRYARRHPSLVDLPDITHTREATPGDPLNVALIGTKADLIKIMLAERWYPLFRIPQPVRNGRGCRLVPAHKAPQGSLRPTFQLSWREAASRTCPQ
jgi:hypothetical protein